MEWISVKVNVPELDVYVLGWGKDGPEYRFIVAKYVEIDGCSHMDDFGWQDTDSCSTSVEYWMPLPKSPNE